MDSFGDEPARHYYNILGLGNDASANAIRTAYKKLAMKWHPDKCGGQNRAEAKVKFQEIQQAYAVLSDEMKKLLYDNGLYDPDEDEEDIEGFTSFMNEMSDMMSEVQASEDPFQKGSSFEELQELFVSMFNPDLATFNNSKPPRSANSMNLNTNKGCRGG